MLSAKSSENFLSPDQNWANLGGFGGLGSGGLGFQKVSFFTLKGKSVARRLSHFASKSFEGCDLQVGSGKKQKVTETPIGKTCRR